MTTGRIFALATAAVVLLTLLAFGLERTQFYGDTNAGIESGKALLHVNEHHFDFHTWRPVGHSAWNCLLAAIAGEANMIVATTVTSVLLAALGILALVRLTRHWGGSETLAILLAVTCPVIIHFANSGVTDIQHFTCVAWAVSVLLGATPIRHEWSRTVLFCTLIALAGSSRPTLLGLGFTFLLARDLGRVPLSTVFFRQSFMAGFVVAVVGAQLLVLVMMRGREYGWDTFSSMFSGLIDSHTSGELLNAYGPGDGLLQVPASWGVPLFATWVFLLIRGGYRNEIFRHSMAWLAWWSGHLALIGNYQARYYITGLVIAIPAVAVLLTRYSRSVRVAVSLLVLIPALGKLPGLLEHQRRVALESTFSRDVATEIAGWDCRDHVYRGQYFSLRVAGGPDWPRDPYIAIYSVDRSSLNIFDGVRLRLWKTRTKIGWNDMTSWTSGLIDGAVTENAPDPLLDRTAMVLCPAPDVYTEQSLPRNPKSVAELSGMNPADFDRANPPDLQMPLVAQRLRRHRITVEDGIVRAGPLVLKGTGPDDWSGWPAAGRLQRMGRHWDLVWVDRLVLYSRKGVLFSWSWPGSG